MWTSMSRSWGAPFVRVCTSPFLFSKTLSKQDKVEALILTPVMRINTALPTLKPVNTNPKYSQARSTEYIPQTASSCAQNQQLQQDPIKPAVGSYLQDIQLPTQTTTDWQPVPLRTRHQVASPTSGDNWIRSCGIPSECNGTTKGGNVNLGQVGSKSHKSTANCVLAL